MAEAVYSTASLRDSQAQEFRSMEGKLNPGLLKGLESMGYEYMTPVQSKVLSDLPSFKSDCLVQAKTGTGKTIAFLLPALHSLLESKSLPKGQVGILVLSPTRELALQIAKECDQLTSQLPTRLDCHTAFGGTARNANLKKFLNGSPSILVATPGRMQDYLSDEETRFKLENLQTLVLDEADTMLERGFLADVKSILRLLPNKNKGWQGMCFSATVPDKIKDVLNVVLKPGYASISTINKSEAPTVSRVPQFFVTIPSVAELFTTLLAVIREESTNASKMIVFGITANMVALYAKLFEGLVAFPIYQLQSRLSQTVRTRTTEEFKAAKSGVMFASDVIGRGMDFPEVGLVIQAGLPTNGEQYVHRVGRTGRAGNDGRAVIILTEQESFFLKRNPQLPIKPHPSSAEILKGAQYVAEDVEQAMYALDETTKGKAYSSFLGFFAGSGLLKPLQTDKRGLVAMANKMAVEGMHCPEPPAMEKSTIGKMGLKGVPGIRFGVIERQPNNRSRPQPAKSQQTRPQITEPSNPNRVQKPKPSGRSKRSRRTDLHSAGMNLEDEK